MALKFELGGVKGWCPEGRLAVNIVQPCDIQADIMKPDAFCKDRTVEFFGLSHTLEHIPPQHYEKFLKDLYRKLVPGGCVEVVQTDVALVLDLVQHGALSLRAARTTIFTPADRLRQNPYHLHYNLWSGDMMAEDFKAVGYARVEQFDAGTWSYDQVDELFPEQTKQYHGVAIPNLGVRAYK